MASLAKAFNIFNRAFYSKTPALSFLLQSSLPCNHSMQHAINCLSSKKCLIQVCHEFLELKCMCNSVEVDQFDS